MQRPVPYNSGELEKEKSSQLTQSSSLTSVNTDRLFEAEEVFYTQDDKLYVNIPSSLFNVSNSTIVIPLELVNSLYDGMSISLKKRDNNSLSVSDDLEYNRDYYIKKFNTQGNIIELYYDKELSNKVNFTKVGSGIHQLVYYYNPYKFDSSKLLPYNRTLEDLNAQITDIWNFLIQLESDNPDSFEKILQTITSKYTSYFDLEDEVLLELISEFGYDYLTEIGLNLGTSELSTFYSYLKLLHLLKGSRQGLEFVFQLLGYEAKLVEWWEMPNLTVLPLGDPATFDIVIKLVDQSSLTLQQSGKIRVFTKYYVYPLLRYIIQDILLEFSSLGLGTAGYSDKLFEFDALFNTVLVSTSGYHDVFYDFNNSSPNFSSIIPYQYDNSEGDTEYLSNGFYSEYLMLNDNTINGIMIYLSNPSSFDSVLFSLKKNNIEIISTTYLNIGVGQSSLIYPSTFSVVKGDILTLTLESIHVSDVTVGNSVIWGLY